MSEETQLSSSYASGSNKPDIVTDFVITNLTREYSTGVIKKVEWTYQKLNGRILVEKPGISYLTGSNTDSSFIPFDNLTKGIVTSWITGSLPMDTMDTELHDELVSLRTQKSIRKTPW